MKKLALNIFKLLSITALILGVQSCELFKNNDPKPKTELEKLPTITQEGKNTFGCLVNGKALTITNSTKMTAIYQGGFVQFGSAGIYFIILDPIEVNQTYDLTKVLSSKAKYTVQKDDGTFCFYEFENTINGSIVFSKIDRTNYIISGTFEFSTVTPSCVKIELTNGRFDMQYTP